MEHFDPAGSSGQVDIMDELDVVDILANWPGKPVKLIVDYGNIYLYSQDKRS